MIELKARYKGYVIMVNFHHFGHRNGYVVLEDKQEIPGFDYEQLDVHGGITFNERMNTHAMGEEFKFLEGKYVIGFDCNHSWDTPDYPKWKEVYGTDEKFKGVERTVKFMYDLKEDDSNIRTLEYVKQELFKLVDQLIMVSRKEVAQ